MASIRDSVSAVVWSVVAVLTSTTVILAQDPAPRPVFRAGVDVIEVDVQVMADSGEAAYAQIARETGGRSLPARNRT